MKPTASILIGVLAYSGQVSVIFMESLIRLMDEARKHGISVLVRPLSNECLLARGRNALAADFIGRLERTHLLFIDADIGFDPRCILRMLAFDRPLMGVAYPKKGFDWARIQAAAQNGQPPVALAQAGLHYALNLGDEDQPAAARVPVQQGFAKVAKCGTGLMMIRRDVLTAMTARYAELQYVNDIPDYDLPHARDHFYGLFDALHHPVSRRYLSEDYAFCHRWTQGCGGEIWVDVESVVTHQGSCSYRGSFLSVTPFTPDAIA